ncbi:hypothetical protein NX059_008600 [Plenodomus lindquistii]|nr:hypothetical protein NX059_008600 [Plenodomus lindquistii]
MNLPQTLPVNDDHITTLPRATLRSDDGVPDDPEILIIRSHPTPPSIHLPKALKVSWVALHTQNLIDVMAELEFCQDPRAAVLFKMALAGNHHALNEEALKELRREGVGPFKPNIFESPVLAGWNLQPFAFMPDADDIQHILLAEIGAPNVFRFAPTRGSVERDARAAAELLGNIANPRFKDPGAIIHMDSPTFDRLSLGYDRWEHLGFLGQTRYKTTIAPANEVFELVHHDHYLFSTLLVGCKVWLAFPPHPANMDALRQGYEDKWLEASDTAMMNTLPKLQHGIFIVQRPGETLLIPPHWSFMVVSTQTSTCCESWRAMATKYVDRLSSIGAWVLMNRLWPTKNLQQSYLVSYVRELGEHLEHILNGNFKYFNPSKVITKLCNGCFKLDPKDSNKSTLNDMIKTLFVHIEDAKLAQRLEASFKQSWIDYLEVQRKKKARCRLCHLRIEIMPGDGHPRGRLTRHFLDAHWNA